MPVAYTPLDVGHHLSHRPGNQFCVCFRHCVLDLVGNYNHHSLRREGRVNVNLAALGVAIPVILLDRPVP
jgi:hypothetical protein